jgi:hypothetical protein
MKCSTKFAKGALFTFIMLFENMILLLLGGFKVGFAHFHGTFDALLCMEITYVVSQRFVIAKLF